jgi:hypothetical protein
MRKTLRQLTAGDNLFKVLVNSNNYSKITVRSVDSADLSYGSGYAEYFKRIDDFYIKHTDNKTYLFFSNEVDVIRYCKSQLMKVLFSKIEDAKNAINIVKDLRLNNFELLNHDWTENQINLLERQINN